MSFRLDSPSRRIAFAIGVSLLLHTLVLWGPNIHLPDFRPALPALTAKLEALPAALPKRKAKRKARPAAKENIPPPQPAQPSPATTLAASAPAAASAPVETETLASNAKHAADRPPLPEHAQLTFAIHMGKGGLRVGETVHTLDIHDGRYVLKSHTTTVGLARLFKSYELNQYSNGSYDKDGLRPELFTEERIDRLGTQRDAVELDHDAQRARFSSGADTGLPPDTQDILSVMYQFPPLANTEIVGVSVCNGRKIEQYDFEIATNEEIDTPLGKMLAVKLSKMHRPNEEGLEIWLAREYRLFPVKIRFTEKNGQVAAEAVITDMRVSEEQGVRKDAAN